MKSECLTVTTQEKLVLRENQSTLTILNLNKKKVTKVIVDGCEITNGIRCDYMLLENDMEYYIELKGEGIDHAFEQIKKTILRLSSNAKLKPKTCLVICTRSPLSSTKIQNVQIQFKKEFNSKLIVKSSPMEYRLN